MTTSPQSSLMLTCDQAGGAGGTEREEGPSDCRLFRYWFEQRRSRNIVKLLFYSLFRKLQVVQ